MSARVVTLGCRLNAFESEVLAEQAMAAGLTDTVIVNTCAVTAKAERQARQTIRRLRREQPNARIIVTGCAAQIAPLQFKKMAEVDRVVGNVEKLNMKALAADDGKVLVSDIMTAKQIGAQNAGQNAGMNHLLGGFKNRTRAFVQVQQGCDHRCSFCIVPFARGPNQSIQEARIMEQARRLVANGHLEIVLTGADVSSYGVDLAGRSRLGRLACRLLQELPELQRLRLTSLDPAGVDDELFDLLASEPRFMPHLHLSLQSGSDIILKRMKRRHDMKKALEVCQRARSARPDIVLGADLIAGFPTETEEMFLETLSAINDLGLVFLHVFPYSKRPGVAASLMPEVASGVCKRRAARLRKAGEASLTSYLASQVGLLAKVLVEKNNRGHTEHFAEAELDFAAKPGTVVLVRLTAVKDGRLAGERPA